MPESLLELPADQKVEFLVGAAELNIGFEHHGVIALNKGVKELVDRDGLTIAVTSGEIVPLKHAGDRVFGCQLYQFGRRQLDPASGN